MKLGDPAAGVTMIQPPLANNTGAANLAYPLEVPPGRRGVQPTLAVTYSSNGQASWLGHGWDLAVPIIEIDTRFGVPRYEDGRPEQYLFNGDQLVPEGPFDGGVRFRRRVENEFDRIVRYGDSHRNFSWMVTSKDGTRFILGSDPARDPRAEAPQSRLQSGAGNIFRWYLDRMVDVFSNRMDYFYTVDRGNNGDAFVQTYLRRIDYTAHGTGSFGDLRPQYHVDFILGATVAGTAGNTHSQRPDVAIDGKPGFQVLTRQLLARVDVRFHEEVIRSYHFAYKEGDFAKTLLSSISYKGFDGRNTLYDHRFDYFTTPRDEVGFPSLFSLPAPVTWGPVKKAPGTNRPEDGLTKTKNEAAGASGFTRVRHRPAVGDLRGRRLHGVRRDQDRVPGPQRRRGVRPAGRRRALQPELPARPAGRSLPLHQSASGR